jgi:hypothetical protein
MQCKPAVITIEFGGQKHVIECIYLGQNIPPSYAEKLFYQGLIKPTKSASTYQGAAEAPKATFSKGK